MVAIGIRVTPSAVFYSVCKDTGESIEILSVDKLVIPMALDQPRKLAFIRTTFLSIVAEYAVRYAGIRLTESNSRTLNIFRVNIEGVLQELLADAAIADYFCGTIATIAMHTRVDRTTVRGYFEGTTIFGEIEDWASYKAEERESIVVSCAALNLSER